MGSATSTSRGSPGRNPVNRRGVTSWRGSVALSSAVTTQAETNSTASRVDEVTDSRTRGAPATVSERVAGSVSKIADCPGSAARS